MWQKGKKLDKGKYIIQEKLGEGGFGITFLAKDNKGKKFVIKTLNQEVQNHSEYHKFKQDFINEALNARGCHHKYIINIIKVIYENVTINNKETELPCIVMDSIKGKSLAYSNPHKEAFLSEEKALHYIKQIGEGLILIHEKELLHRDIKPSNILIKENSDQIVIIDFGISRSYSSEENNQHTAFNCPGFSPLEQFSKDEKEGTYTDVYALSATLYYLLTKITPPSASQRYYEVSEGRSDLLKSPQQFNNSISDSVKDAIIKGLELNPENRTQTVEQFLRDLGIGIENNHSLPPTVPVIITEKKPNFMVIIPSLLGLAIIFISILYFLVKKPSFIEYSIKNTQNYGVISLEYPENWEISDDLVTPAKFTSPKEKNQGNFLESITITVENAKNLSLDEYTQETLNIIEQDPNKTMISDRNDVTLNNQEAFEVVYIEQENQSTKKTLQTWTIFNNRAYIITYEADEDQYNQYEKIVQKIIESFQIK